MISEIDNISKGRVEATVEYDSNKKLIGVATSNLLPGVDGLPPLAKQGAFEKVKEATSTDVSAMDALTDTLAPADDEYEKIEKLDLQNLSSQNDSNALNTPDGQAIGGQEKDSLETNSDIVFENPLDVKNPHELDGLSIGSEFEKTDLQTNIQTPENQSDENKFLDFT